jgi:hypothetical protein
MRARGFLPSVVLAVSVAALPWGIDQAGAKSKAPEQPQTAPQTTIVDAGGRVHRVMPMHSITHAQKKAAAQRQKAKRAQAGQKKHGAPTGQGEVTK